MTPFLKSNPFLSMWLSGANAMAGAARGAWMAEARRQQTAMVAEASRQMMEFWTGGMLRNATRAAPVLTAPVPAPAAAALTAMAPVPAPAAAALTAMARIAAPMPSLVETPKATSQVSSRALASRPASRSTPRLPARKPATVKPAKAKRGAR